MIIGTRQTKYGAVKVPEIEIDKNIELSNYWLSIKNSLTNAIIKRFNYEYDKETINICIEQSLNFLTKIEAIPKEGDVRKEIINLLKSKEIELWEKWIPLSPIYEGINVQLNTMLIKAIYPIIYKNMTDETKPLEQRVYSHFGLTIIKESITYTLEYLQKEGFLKEELSLIEEEKFKEWIKND